MSNELNPATPTPVEYSKEQLQQAFSDFLLGSVVANVDQVRDAGSIIGSLDTPYARSAAIDAEIFPIFFKEQEPLILASGIESCVFNGLRAYTYSGLPINREVVELAVRAIGKDRRWIREAVAPTGTVVNHVIGVESDEEEYDLFARGQLALHALGFKMWPNRIFGPRL